MTFETISWWQTLALGKLGSLLFYLALHAQPIDGEIDKFNFKRRKMMAGTKPKKILNVGVNIIINIDLR